MRGYKQMMRDRMPAMLDLALRWCKAKERWIDYAYTNLIVKESKNNRSNAVKIALGIKQRWKRQEIYDTLRYSEFKSITKKQVDNIPKSQLFMSFSDTINWMKLKHDDDGMYEYWKVIAEWVNWFSKNHMLIESTYKHCKRWDMSDEEIIPILMSKYEIENKLAKFLIKSFK